MKLKDRGMYVVERGERVGCFLIYIKEANIFESYAFLCIPNPMEVLYLDKNDIKEGLRNGYMKFIEELPGDVYDVCAANFRWHAKKAGL